MGGPAVLRDIAMATNFGTQLAITGFVGYNFGCDRYDTLFDSAGGKVMNKNTVAPFFRTQCRRDLKPVIRIHFVQVSYHDAKQSEVRSNSES